MSCSPSGSSASLIRRSAVFTASAWVLARTSPSSAADLAVGDDLARPFEQTGHDRPLRPRHLDRTVAEGDAPVPVEVWTAVGIGAPGDGDRPDGELMVGALTPGSSPRAPPTPVGVVRSDRRRGGTGSDAARTPTAGVALVGPAHERDVDRDGRIEFEGMDTDAGRRRRRRLGVDRLGEHGSRMQSRFACELLGCAPRDATTTEGEGGRAAGFTRCERRGGPRRNADWRAGTHEQPCAHSAAASTGPGRRRRCRPRGLRAESACGSPAAGAGCVPGASRLPARDSPTSRRAMRPPTEAAASALEPSTAADRERQCEREDRERGEPDHCAPGPAARSRRSAVELHEALAPIAAVMPETLLDSRSRRWG